MHRPVNRTGSFWLVPHLFGAGPDMDVIVHLGVHRSATTTLQRHLTNNAVAYRKAGLESWTPPMTRAGLFTGLIQKPTMSTPLIDDHAARSANRVRLEIDRLERGDTRHLVISEENIIGAIRRNLRDRSLYSDLPGRLSRFLPALGGRATVIALGLRAYDSYWASALAFAIGRGSPAPDGSLLRELSDQPRGWRAILTEIADLCPAADIVVWPFEALAGDPARQVALMSGGPRLATSEPRCNKRHNASPDKATLNAIVGRDVGPTAPSADAARGAAWMPFDPEQRARMRTRYLEDLDWLASGSDHRIRFFGTAQDTADQRRVNHTRMLDRASEITGFAAAARAWTPLNGGQGIGNERRMV